MDIQNDYHLFLIHNIYETILKVLLYHFLIYIQNQEKIMNGNKLNHQDLYVNIALIQYLQMK